ncbi:hypothetical protein F753_18715 [Stutzerimonas chloritidismutans AW-1]|uniref:Uncharacterized protein n=1 Tax=Stutzerimonas chloritidismutans AW-1 TaxID=1263865 RepID=V4QD69_STUCH|nr:hypothetical protein F753_18715 [Stutzerimonas chloritidismutans AW-1]
MWDISRAEVYVVSIALLGEYWNHIERRILS